MFFLFRTHLEQKGFIYICETIVCKNISVFITQTLIMNVCTVQCLLSLT